MVHLESPIFLFSFLPDYIHWSPSNCDILKKCKNLHLTDHPQMKSGGQQTSHAQESLADLTPTLNTECQAWRRWVLFLNSLGSNPPPPTVIVDTLPLDYWADPGSSPNRLFAQRSRWIVVLYLLMYVYDHTWVQTGIKSRAFLGKSWANNPWKGGLTVRHNNPSPRLM